MSEINRNERKIIKKFIKYNNDFLLPFSEEILSKLNIDPKKDCILIKYECNSLIIKKR